MADNRGKSEKKKGKATAGAAVAPKVKVHDGPSKAISTTLLDAVDMLHNNAIRVTETKGAISEVKVAFPKELVAMARGLFPANKHYDFQIHMSLTLPTIAGGVFNTQQNWSPGVTTFAEWAALSALFDEVKLISVRMDLTSAFGPTSTAIVFQVVTAPDRIGSTGATPTYTATQRLAESEVLHPYTMAAKPGVFTKIHRLNRDRPYASISTPAGASGIPSGCLGQWSFASNIVGTASINYMFGAFSQVVRLRSRA